MGLEAYSVRRDHFEPEDDTGLCFPCCACRHRHGTDMEEPCIRCDWNLGAPVTRAIATKAENLLEVAYEDDGAIDGFLEKLSAHGQFEFVVYDALDDRAIKCEVEESKLQSAWSAFRKRVEVLGRVRYRKDGMPVSVRAKEIILFPSSEEIPSVSEMRRLLAGG